MKMLSIMAKLLLVGYTVAMEFNTPKDGDVPVIVFDYGHAHCSLHATTTIACEDTIAAIYGQIYYLTSNPEKDPATPHGQYNVSGGSKNYIKATRTTPAMKYVDDIIFNYTSA